jgi:GTP-binding protein
MKKVAIVGRPNVGKSALFNRLANKKISIVHDQPGITRDRICGVCKLGKRPFEIIDTGGIGYEADPEFAEPTRLAAEAAIESADVLLLVADAQVGATPLDRDLASRLYHSGRPLILVANKVDHPRHDPLIADFSQLAPARTIGVSAVHGRGIKELIAAIEELLPVDDDSEAVAVESARRARIVILGKPNVGKSSLTNAILGDERTIVSEIAGTTRDAIDIDFDFADQLYTLCDTAGMRHRSKHKSSVEVFSVMRSEKALRSADLCVLVIDAAQGVTRQDKKIAQQIQEHSKGILIALNKWDLIEPEQSNAQERRELLQKYLDEVRRDLFFLPYAPVVALSAKTGRNVTRLFQSIEKIRQHATRRIGTGELNRHLTKCIEAQPPPMRKNRRLNILYATQVEPRHAGPFAPPEIVLFVNDVQLLSDQYREFLIRCIRGKWEFPGLPIKLLPRGRESVSRGDKQ